jgi:AcrR family transcriptional regulator
MAGTAKRSANTAKAPRSVDTRARLIQAAAAEFNAHGYAGTDTNRIARRAGFAPQTFYRWFADKLSIFIAVYRVWEDTERAFLSELIERKASTQQMRDAAVQHHRNHLVFRRSLRQLSVENPAMRRARAESRKRQIAQIKLWQQKPGADAGRIAAALLQMERLADALAEGEFQDLGLTLRAGERALGNLIGELRSRRR